MDKWMTLRLGQNAVDALLEEEYRLKCLLDACVKQRKKIEADVNLAFDIAMKVARIEDKR